MRYLKAILILCFALFIVFQLIYNLAALTAPVPLALRLPGITLGSLHFPVWIGFILIFTLGFLIAIGFEVFFWFGYTRTIRQQKKLIQSLEKELGEMKSPTPAETQIKPDP